ncbi:protein kinase [Streptomyces sp. NPDC059009]|uniref:protein kinase domain-containing protein n=1 Tax=Streptomyces sp. NPDC059009 TaxID=3346694 RepID=UPI0036C66BA2
MGQGRGDAWATWLGGAVGDGRYVLGQLLGRGGMAAVHQAHDTRLDRLVAIKTMHAELGRDQDFLQRFEREAQTVARINHPNVVAVHDSGEQEMPDGAPPVAYIVMEYVAGRSLGEVLRDEAGPGGRLDPARALALTADVLAALAASHELGLVHRDIKPANVMLTDRGVVKVMDFGIARAQGGDQPVTQLTRTGVVIGTPHYLSPEQAQALPLDGRSDLYAVGVMLFQLLTGQLPFDGDSFTAIAVKHVTQPPPLLADLGVTVPPAVQLLLSRALEKDPARRFATAEEMRAEVDRVRGVRAAPAMAPLQAPFDASAPAAVPTAPDAMPAAPPPPVAVPTAPAWPPGAGGGMPQGTPTARPPAAVVAGLLALVTAGLLVSFAVVNIVHVRGGVPLSDAVRMNVIGGLVSAALLALLGVLMFTRTAAVARSLAVVCALFAVLILVLQPLLGVSFKVSFSEQLDFVFGFHKTNGVMLGLATIFDVLTAIAAAVAAAAVRATQGQGRR